MNVPLCVLIIGAVTGNPLWLVIKHPGAGPGCSGYEARFPRRPQCHRCGRDPRRGGQHERAAREDPFIRGVLTIGSGRLWSRAGGRRMAWRESWRRRWRGVHQRPHGLSRRRGVPRGWRRWLCVDLALGALQGPSGKDGHCVYGYCRVRRGPAAAAGRNGHRQAPETSAFPRADRALVPAKVSTRPPGQPRNPGRGSPALPPNVNIDGPDTPKTALGSTGFTLPKMSGGDGSADPQTRPRMLKPAGTGRRCRQLALWRRSERRAGLATAESARLHRTSPWRLPRGIAAASMAAVLVKCQGAVKAVSPSGVPRPVGPLYPGPAVHRYAGLQDPLLPDVMLCSAEACSYGYLDG